MFSLSVAKMFKWSQSVNLFNFFNIVLISFATLSFLSSGEHLEGIFILLYSLSLGSLMCLLG